jgi:hypothetical protein
MHFAPKSTRPLQEALSLIPHTDQQPNGGGDALCHGRNPGVGASATATAVAFAWREGGKAAALAAFRGGGSSGSGGSVDHSAALE